MLAYEKVIHIKFSWQLASHPHVGIQQFAGIYFNKHQALNFNSPFRESSATQSDWRLAQDFQHDLGFTLKTKMLQVRYACAHFLNTALSMATF